MSGCGSCSMCCRIPEIPRAVGDPRYSASTESGSKPLGEWCKHCKPKLGGCGIYEERGGICREYECVWLQSQTKENPMPKNLRPDKSKVLIQPTSDGAGLTLRTLPENWGAWKRGAMKRLVQVYDEAGAVIIAMSTDGKRSAVSRAAIRKLSEWEAKHRQGGGNTETPTE